MTLSYRGYYGIPTSDPWASLVHLAAWLAALLIIATVWALFESVKHLSRAFAREPQNPLLWTLLALSMGLGTLAVLVGTGSDWRGVAAGLGLLAALAALLLVLVGVTISLGSEQVLPREPESLVTTAFKRSWW